MGEIARGELAYQPALLPQELAAEVAANRESSARMDNALSAVMQRSRELSAQALELQAQSSKLARLVAAEEAQDAEHRGLPQRRPQARAAATRTRSAPHELGHPSLIPITTTQPNPPCPTSTSTRSLET